MKKKVCIKCKEELGITEFSKNKNSKDGLQSSCKLCRKKYYLENKEKEQKKNKEYQLSNKDSITEQRKIYRKENRKVISSKHKDYIKERKLTDTVFRLKEIIRTKIKKSLRKFGYIKQYNTQKTIGCTYEDFKTHIESQWEEWMNWDNYGKYNGEENYGWDLDHIIPLSSVDTEEDIIRLNHYSNIQPLCSYVNRVVKKDKKL